MNKQPISRETGGLSDSKRLTTNDDDEQTTIAKDNDNDNHEFELQESSSFCVTIRFTTRPMTNNNSKLDFGSTKSLLKRQFQL